MCEYTNFEIYCKQIKQLLNNENYACFERNICFEIRLIDENINMLKKIYNKIIYANFIKEEENKEVQKLVYDIFDHHYGFAEKIKSFSNKNLRGLISPSISKIGKEINRARGKVTHREIPIHTYYRDGKEPYICNVNNAYLEPYSGEVIEIEVFVKDENDVIIYQETIYKFIDNIKSSIDHTLKKYIERLSELRNNQEI